jgi:hypothetical protein
MANPIVWPLDALPCRSLSAVKLFANTKGNPSISGLTQVVASHAGRWKIVAGGFPIVTKDRIKLWRAIEGMAQGQLGQFIFPLNELDRVPIQAAAVALPHSDGTYFSDGKGYTQNNYSATASGDAVAYATSITIKHYTQAPPEPGQKFSAGVRLYAITQILSSTATTVTVGIWPPLRDVIADGDDLNFDGPRCLCRLASDNEMAVEELDMGLWGTGNISFIEDTGAVLE